MEVLLLNPLNIRRLKLNKKIEKSIKFAMKAQNLSFDTKTNSMIKPHTKAEPAPKKRSVSPGTKMNPKFSASQAIKLAQNKPRGGSRKKTMRSPGIIGKF